MASNRLDRLVGMAGVESNYSKVTYRRVALDEFSMELFQRVRFVAGGLMGKGIHWDLGVYGSFGVTDYELMATNKADAVSDGTSMQLVNLKALSAYNYNYGVVTRISYDFVGLYARYRLTGIGVKLADDKALLPRLEVGLQLCF